VGWGYLYFITQVFYLSKSLKSIEIGADLNESIDASGSINNIE